MEPQLINNSWEQTQVYILNSILNEITSRETQINFNPNIEVQPPQINFNPNIEVQPPIINIDLSQIVQKIEEVESNLQNKIEEINPVVIIESKPYTQPQTFPEKKSKRETIYSINIKGQKLFDLKDEDWILVKPSKVKVGYMDNINFRYEKYQVRSEKLCWFIKNEKERTIIIKRPKVETKEYYIEAIKEAQLIGLDLTAEYIEKIK